MVGLFVFKVSKIRKGEEVMRMKDFICKAVLISAFIFFVGVIIVPICEADLDTHWVVTITVSHPGNPPTPNDVGVTPGAGTVGINFFGFAPEVNVPVGGSVPFTINMTPDAYDALPKGGAGDPLLTVQFVDTNPEPDLVIGITQAGTGNEEPGYPPEEPYIDYEDGQYKVVPEPATMAMFGLGVLGVALKRKRFRFFRK